MATPSFLFVYDGQLHVCNKDSCREVSQAEQN
jgi:hypothetical protein